MVVIGNDTGAVLLDLEIERDDMFTDPAAFSERLLEKGKELAAIIRQDTSVAALTNSVKKEAEDTDVPEKGLAILQDAYHFGDDISLPELATYIDQVSTLLNDLKNTLRDRVTQEATLQNSAVVDKRFAHMQYVRLRKAYEAYRTAIKIFNPEKMLPIMPAMPGNYGGPLSSNLTYYAFEIKERPGELFMSHRAVAKLVGLKDRFDSLRSFLDWCETPEGMEVVTVREVKQ